MDGEENHVCARVKSFFLLLNKFYNLLFDSDEKSKISPIRHQFIVCFFRGLWETL